MNNKIALVFFTVLLVIIFTGCEMDTDLNSLSGPYLFMTDTYNGYVYTYDLDAEKASDTTFCSTRQNSTGKIYFYNDMGYITVGAPLSGSNFDGLYYFDPEALFPVPERIGDLISAQYAAFYSDTKGYVTEADVDEHYNPLPGGVYIFNPSNPEEGLTGPIAGTVNDGSNGIYLQDVVAGTDGFIYAADNGNGRIIKIDPVTDTVVPVTYNTSSGYTTGLEAVRIDNINYIFAANTSTIDRLNCDTGVITKVCNTGAVYLTYDIDSGYLYTTGWSNSYYMDTSELIPWTALDIFDNGAPFGGTDILIYNGFIYISNAGWSVPYNSKLYIIEAGTGNQTQDSPVLVMDPENDAVAGLAVYEY